MLFQTEPLHVPRSIIPEAVFREFPAKTLRKLPVSGRNPPGSARNSTQESGDRIRLSVLTGSGRNRINRVTGSVHQNTAYMKSPEYHGTDRFLPYVFDLGTAVKILSINNIGNIVSFDSFL